MSKLVVFYSRADENYFGGTYRYIDVGNTEKIARMIADITGAKLFKIEQKIPYSKEYSVCIDEAKKDKQNGARPELVHLINSLDGYDEIYLGYPNFWGDMPMAVYTFLEKFDWNGKVIYPFCTHEGSGLSNTESKIKSVCKGANVVKGLAVNGSSVDSAKGVVEKWLM